MKQSSARLCLFVALLFSSISLIFTAIAFSIPRWKSMSIASNFSLIHPMDPLIRSELDKYLRYLYQPGEVHYMGLTEHCLSTGLCGRNFLPTFDLSQYASCHNIHYHRQCLFSHSLDHSNDECHCDKPFYIRLIRTLITLLLICQGIFLLINILRLARQHYHLDFLDDLPLRIISLITALFALIFSITVVIQTHLHRFDEPLEFFQMMHRYYSHLQIYSFTNDLHVILEHLERVFDLRLGFCYVAMILVFVCSLVCLICASTVEIKILPFTSNVVDDQKSEDYYQNPAPPREFFPRQTKV